MRPPRRSPQMPHPGMKRVPFTARALPLPQDWRPQASPGLTVIHELARPRIRIGGEPFYVEEDAGVVYLRHPSWSLVGAGDTLSEAEADLRNDASELAVVMAAMPLKSLDYDAQDLFRFVLRIG